MLTDTASEIVDLDQPNSCSSGRNRTLGVARTAAAARRTRKVTASASHAGWIARRGVVRGVDMSGKSRVPAASSGRYQCSCEIHGAARGSVRRELRELL